MSGFDEDTKDSQSGRPGSYLAEERGEGGGYYPRYRKKNFYRSSRAGRQRDYDANWREHKHSNRRQSRTEDEASGSTRRSETRQDYRYKESDWPEMDDSRRGGRRRYGGSGGGRYEDRRSYSADHRSDYRSTYPIRYDEYGYPTKQESYHRASRGGRRDHRRRSRRSPDRSRSDYHHRSRGDTSAPFADDNNDDEYHRYSTTDRYRNTNNDHHHNGYGVDTTPEGRRSRDRQGTSGGDQNGGGVDKDEMYGLSTPPLATSIAKQIAKLRSDLEATVSSADTPKHDTTRGVTAAAAGIAANIGIGTAQIGSHGVAPVLDVNPYAHTAAALSGLDLIAWNSAILSAQQQSAIASASSLPGLSPATLISPHSSIPGLIGTSPVGGIPGAAVGTGATTIAAGATANHNLSATAAAAAAVALAGGTTGGIPGQFGSRPMDPMSISEEYSQFGEPPAIEWASFKEYV